MNEKLEKESFGFPTNEGVSAGSITHVRGGYLGQTQGGVPFIIGDAENLVATFVDIAEKLAYAIMDQLDNQKNLNKMINFTFMVDDKNSLVPADLPEAQKKILLGIIHSFRSGKLDDSEEVDILTEDEPITIVSQPAVQGNESKLDEKDGITKDGMKKIHDAKKSGKDTIIIEKG